MNATDLAYYEWLITAQGLQGETGKEIVFQVLDRNIQYNMREKIFGLI